MSISFKALVLLTVQGFIPVKCNLAEEDPGLDIATTLEMHLTTRPPHRIFFIESGNKIERVIDDGFMQMAPVPMSDSMPVNLFSSRGVASLQNSTGFSDSWIPSSPIDVSANRGDNNLFSADNPPPGDSPRDYPSVILTPQRFFHIKVSIPRAFYSIRVYPEQGDVDVVEIISKPTLQSQRSSDSNSMPGSQQPAAQTLFSDPPTLANQPGWQSAGPGMSNQQVISVKQNQPVENPLSPSGSSYYYMRNPGQFNEQNGGPGNFNRQPADFRGNHLFGGPSQFPAASGRVVDSLRQYYAPSVQEELQGGPSFQQMPSLHPGQSFQTGQRFQPGQPTQNVPSFQQMPSLQPGQSFQTGQPLQPGQPTQNLPSFQQMPSLQPGHPAQNSPSFQQMPSLQPGQSFQTDQPLQPGQLAQNAPSFQAQPSQGGQFSQENSQTGQPNGQQNMQIPQLSNPGFSTGLPSPVNPIRKSSLFSSTRFVQSMMQPLNFPSPESLKNTQPSPQLKSGNAVRSLDDGSSS